MATWKDQVQQNIGNDACLVGDIASGVAVVDLVKGKTAIALVAFRPRPENKLAVISPAEWVMPLESAEQFAYALLKAVDAARLHSKVRQ